MSPFAAPPRARPTFRMTLPAPFTKALVWTLPALVLLSIAFTHRRALERVEHISAQQAERLLLVPAAESPTPRVPASCKNEGLSQPLEKV